MNDCIIEAYENLSDENVIVNLNCCKILGPDCAIMLCDIFQKAYKINSTIIQYSVDYVTKTFGWKWDKQNQLLKKLESLKLITTMKKGIPPIRYVKLNKHNTK